MPVPERYTAHHSKNNARISTAYPGATGTSTTDNITAYNDYWGATGIPELYYEAITRGGSQGSITIPAGIEHPQLMQTATLPTELGLHQIHRNSGGDYSITYTEGWLQLWASLVDTTFKFSTIRVTEESGEADVVDAAVEHTIHVPRLRFFNFPAGVYVSDLDTAPSNTIKTYVLIKDMAWHPSTSV